MLTVLLPGACRSERTTSRRANIRLGAHCTERPEVNQDKPNSKPRLREIPRPSTSTVCTANALGTRRRLRRRSGVSPLYDVKKAASRACAAGGKVALVQGCQAGGASRDRTGDLKLAKLALSQLSYGPDPLSEQRGGINLPAHHEQSGGPGKI